MKVGDFLNGKYGEGAFEISLEDSYYNMKEVIEKHMHLVENAKEAMTELGIEPEVVPIRGGTDGARLSLWGCLAPIFVREGRISTEGLNMRVPTIWKRL